MQHQKTQLTTVKVLSGLYRDFKKAAVDDDISLHYLINTSLAIYLGNPSFRSLILCSSASLASLN
ncbi:MAG: hypothetical protein WC346_05280 [Methanogenium sp.]|jgi:hypothetical protein